MGTPTSNTGAGRRGGHVPGSLAPVSSLRPVSGSTESVVDALEAWLAAPAEPDALVVETSGSTGRPKQVLLSRRALLASVDATHARLSGPGQWLLALPITYVAGLQVALRSLRAGHRPVEVLDGDWAAAVSRVSADRIHTSLVPTQLHRLLDDPAAVGALRRVDTVLLGGGPIDPALRARAEATGVSLVATYGSSETAGGCVYDGVPLDGVRLEFEETGRLRIAGPMLFDGYLDDAELTAQTLVDGWLLTSDLGRVVDGRLQLLGRVDDVVISGGLNVPTPVVAARLRDHPGIEAAEVLGVPDGEWGHRVVAFVKLAAPADDLLDLTRAWVVEGGVDRRWAPRQVVVVDEFPQLSNGKLDRVELRRLAGADS